MLEHIDLDKNIDKAKYQEIFPELERQLGECQRQTRQAQLPLVIVFEGWDAAGKGTLINRFTQALDPRGFKVYPISAPDDAERLHPWMWRFWQTLPAAGDWALHDRSWYVRVLIERIGNLAPRSEWQQAYEDIRQFEQQLVDAGAVLVKFWLHISQAEQRQRFEVLAEKPATAWKVGKQEWQQQRDYSEWQEAVEELLQRTSPGYAPWTIVEATHGRYARTKVFQTVQQAIQVALARRAAKVVTPAPPPVPAPPPIHDGTILDRVDLSVALERTEYEQQLDKLQKRLHQLEHELWAARVPAVIVYEGWDAAGKGGNIRRLTHSLDPRGYEVVPVAAPDEEERARHYLWRFWRRLPKAGHLTIFDRSWYGRVLVERVEGFCSEEAWKRAYAEINEFERQLVEFGTVIVKFWLHIDQDEQLRRFREREQLPFKQWKITDEDWRNRDRWKPYEAAVVEMLERTSTRYAPWTILEADCKLHARIKALRTVVEALEKGLQARLQKSNPSAK